MPNREVFTNNASTTLASSANTTTTSLSLTDGSPFPSTGNFRVIAGSEIMLATARSSNTVTVVRGQEGTSAASHSSGDAITHVLTTGALLQVGADNVATYNAAPPMGIFDASGARITSSSFTQVNCNTCSITDDGATLTISKASGQGNVEDVAALVISQPSTPYSYVANMSWAIFGPAAAGVQEWGVCFRDSGSGKITGFGLLYNASFSASFSSELFANNWSDPSTFDSQPLSPITYATPNPAWIKVTNDATHLTFYVSPNGISWTQALQVSVGSFITPDQVGIFLNNRNNTTGPLTVNVQSFSAQ